MIRTWIKNKDKLPEVNQKVFYYFKVCGVFRGQYYGEDEDGYGSVYAGNSGCLTGDVTHWMEDDGGELPEQPYECPYDFINEFDKWFYYHKCIEFEKLTHKQAVQDINFVFYGWQRVGKYTGMWSPIRK